MTAIQPELWDAPARAKDTPQQAIRGQARRKPVTLAPPAERLVEPRDRVQFVQQILDEYVAAVGTSRPRRSEARALRERAAEIRATLYVPFERLREAEQLEAEAAERDERAELHETRAEALRLQLTDHVEYPKHPLMVRLFPSDSTSSAQGSPHDK